MKESITLAAINGAGLNPWIWDRMLPYLHYDVQAIALPSQKPIDDKEFGLAEYVSSVVEDINAIKTDKVVLLTHSLGGLVGIEAADVLQDKIAGFIGVASVIPPENTSLIEVFSFPFGHSLAAALHVHGTKPPNFIIRRHLSDGLDKADKDRIEKDFVAEAKQVFFDNRQHPTINVPSMYVKTLKDNEITPKLQERMAAILPQNSTVELDAYHLPMLSHAEELAWYVNRFMDHLTQHDVIAT